jgi:hypothetical protein
MSHEYTPPSLEVDVREGNSLSAQEKHSVLSWAPGRPSRQLDVDVARERPVWMGLREILNFRLGQLPRF